MPDLRSLYQEIIVDHNRRPRNFHNLPDANRTAEGDNPLCGDRLTVYLKVEEGVAFREAVLQSAAARAKPITLTGLAAMLGALFILDDPIFNGLAISLIFGILVSTALTLVLIPILYFSYRSRTQRA